ncbi:MAG: hypothetical protein KBT03_09630 [Bacteroidales bacterium]|nr:hypothetical protein [Candidatus Scybalousia scybalohippi]
MTTRKSITNNGIIIFKDQLSTISLLPDDVVGSGLKLLLNNFDSMEQTNNIFYELIATNIRRYREQAGISSQYGKLGGNPTLKGTDKGGDKGTHKQQYNTRKEKNNIFIKPTLEEVENYIKEKKLSVDAKRFYDYYEAGGWKDSRGNKVKNWKQKMLANWVKEEPQKQKEEEYKYWL